MSAALIIAREDPTTPDVASMISELDSYLLALYPPDICYLLSPESLATRSVFFVGRLEGEAVGCGALVPYGRDDMEIKRMYVRASARGLGLGARILDRLEEYARAAGAKRLLLETGPPQEDAVRLYQRNGFVERAPYGDYEDDPLSLFMEKRLQDAAKLSDWSAA